MSIMGNIPDKVHLELKENATPYQAPVHRIPQALHKPLKSELDKPVDQVVLHRHYNTTGHDLSIEHFSIVCSENHNIARSKEAILIRVNNPSLNRDKGKYQLPHIWDEILVRSPALKLK